MITVSYELTGNDFAEFNRFSILKVKSVQKVFLKNFISFGIFLFIIAIIINIPVAVITISDLINGIHNGISDLATAKSHIALVSMSVILSVLFNSLIFVLGFLIVASILSLVVIYFFPFYNFNTLNKLDCQQTLIITPEYVHIKTIATDAQRSWNGIASINESKTLFIFYQSALTTLIIPKRAFNTSESARNFYNTAIEYRNNFINQKLPPGNSI